MDWRTASYSVENGNCVEVASAGTIRVRDTQDRAGVTLSIPAGAWRALAARLKAAVPANQRKCTDASRVYTSKATLTVPYS